MTKALKQYVSRTIAQRRNHGPKAECGVSPGSPMLGQVHHSVVWDFAGLQKKTGIQVVESMSCLGPHAVCPHHICQIQGCF